MNRRNANRRAAWILIVTQFVGCQEDKRTDGATIKTRYEEASLPIPKTAEGLTEEIDAPDPRPSVTATVERSEEDSVEVPDPVDQQYWAVAKAEDGAEYAAYLGFPQSTVLDWTGIEAGLRAKRRYAFPVPEGTGACKVGF